MAPRVAFVVDHPRRDLPGLVLTALALAQHGVECHLVPLNLQQRELWLLAPDLVVLNFARRDNEALANALADAGIAVAVLDTEGGVWAEPQHYLELLWREAATRARAAPVCMWGPALADRLLADGLFTAEQTVVTGSPRHDLYHPRWSSVWGTGAASRPRVLLNTNFSIGNPRFATVAGNQRHLTTRYGWSAARAERVADLERAGVAAFCELARALARDVDADVVLRPHPFEDPAPYQAALAGSGVGINLEGPVPPEILRACAVIQRGCTTAIEAGLAGVPALSPRWIPIAAEFPMVEAVSAPYESYDALRDAVAGHVTRARRGADGAPRPATLTTSTSSVDAALAEVVRQWFTARDGEAHARVVAALLARLPERRRVDERACARHAFGLGESGISRAARASRIVRHALGVRPGFSLRHLRHERHDGWRASDKGFDAPMVAEFAARVLSAAHAGGEAWAPAVVEQAADRGDYRRGYRGCAVTLTATARAAARSA